MSYQTILGRLAASRRALPADGVTISSRLAQNISTCRPRHAVAVAVQTAPPNQLGKFRAYRL